VYPQSEVCGDGIDQNCDGKDLTQPDSYEPNNKCSSCYWISGDDPDVILYPTFDSKGYDAGGGSDLEDYFCFWSVDNFNLPFTSEHLIVELTNQPVGTDGDIFLYKGQQDCEGDKPIASSVTIGGGNEKIDWTETGGDDNGEYFVRVQNWSSSPNCGKPYKLHIQGLK